MLEKIHSCGDYERALFGARRVPFNKAMDRWHSDLRPYQQNNNFFAAKGPLTEADIRTAVELQKSRGLNYLMLRTREPLPQELAAEFGVETEQTLVMALAGDWEGWKENPDLEIRDIQTHDIRRELLDVSDVPEAYQPQARQNMLLVLEVAGDHPEYHWLVGYVNGQKAGSVYCLSSCGCVEMDDLWVEEEFRNRYIATTLMKHIARTQPGILYLHADASRTPKDMYKKMGFETVETTWEYYLEW